MSTNPFSLEFTDIGRLAYAPAFELQRQTADGVLAAREVCQIDSSIPPMAGIVFLVEHDPVVTVSNRAGAMNHLVATPELLEREGVSVERTDRGGDITYHGPGQLVVYPILDLNLLNLGLHDYMRLLEESVIRTCAAFGVSCTRDPKATGVWTQRERDEADDADGADASTLDAGGSNSSGRPSQVPGAKIAAMGVRVRKWISMHGLALNVTTNLDHFRLIVPCGLVGRPVTSLKAELGKRCPSMDDVKQAITVTLRELIAEAYERAAKARARGGR
ncbi:MAG: lipoyl(octanoyl) transferase [Phycisphaerae bacterium]|nr:lipoyl(octanoyl) transferase [Phycisphaerae bacterium]